MPVVTADGIPTAYELVGEGPPLLAFSPGGFNATLDNWSSMGRYRDLRLIEHLSARFTCIVFDRREAGRSGGRGERITWDHYARQGLALLDQLGLDDADVLGGCVGCSVALAVALAHPERVRRLVLFSPAGGARYRLAQQDRFAQHSAHVRHHGLSAVAQLAAAEGRSFSQDPRVGPWAPVLRSDPVFAERFTGQDPDRYLTTVSAMSRLLFDRDTVPGAEPEDLLLLDRPALVVPGDDPSHAVSAARYLGECLPRATYWDAPVSQQTEEAVAAQLLRFLADEG
jgi:pimeloyl-ACP methyl ester carboxylesterase